jgi:type III restriction enzyme
MSRSIDEIQTLEKRLTILMEEADFPVVPEHILTNLKPSFGNRPYQQEAFKRFLYWWDSKRRTQNRFLFHMATGSGKTLIMAGLILDLYKKGYRNFLFFVHLDNIVQKTKENFLNGNSFKYLFANVINIDGKIVKIREVENFESANENDINIVFTTIQGLHSKLNNSKENSMTYEDFENKKLVLISDEAHHLQVDTRISNSKLGINFEAISWESTADRILKSNSKDNILLEFTATAELTNQLILEKYKDVLLFDYPLRKFREDGYSKEVLTYEFDTNDKFERAVQAMVLSQYRLKLFHDHKLNIKPVVMFKANYVNVPKVKRGDSVVSSIFQEEFHKRLKKLNGIQLQKLRANSKDVVQSAFKYFNHKKISLEDLAHELKNDFDESHCICVNTESESVDKQNVINNLENNEYRAVFAVDKLNEGWDVLNLFDIVRLYDTRVIRDGKPGPTTMREAQLIGRGARYFPFKLKLEQVADTRKYTDTDEPLRVCETMYYHCKYNPNYILELRKALRESGILPDRSEAFELKLKASFKKSSLYSNGIYFHNQLEEYKREDINELDFQLKEKRYKCSLPTSTSRAVIIMTEDEISGRATKTEAWTLGNPNHFERKYIQKAIDKNKFFWFDNLQSHYFPNIKSINEFISSKKYLGNLKVDVTATTEQLENLNPEEKLWICSYVLNEIASQLPKGVSKFKGSRKFIAKPIKDTFIDKPVRYIPSKRDGQGHPQSAHYISDSLKLDIPNQAWYAYTENFGTDQEKYLVKFIYNFIDKLKRKYKNIFLLRNERFFQLYNFKDGGVIEPDFVLFLEQNTIPKKVTYQLFIEPKQEKLMTSEDEKKKEEFLLEIEKEHKIETLFANKHFKLIGLPFYNEDAIGKKEEFETKFKEVTGI